MSTITCCALYFKLNSQSVIPTTFIARACHVYGGWAPSKPGNAKGAHSTESKRAHLFFPPVSDITPLQMAVTLSVSHITNSIVPFPLSLFLPQTPFFTQHFVLSANSPPPHFPARIRFRSSNFSTQIPRKPSFRGSHPMDLWFFQTESRVLDEACVGWQSEASISSGKRWKIRALSMPFGRDQPFRYWKIFCFSAEICVFLHDRFVILLFFLQVRWILPVYACDECVSLHLLSSSYSLFFF